MTDWFTITSPFEKVSRLPEALGEALTLTEGRIIFELGRDARVVQPAELPRKPGLSSAEGQARLLHDLASIELQAMELGLRTLAEFPEAPREFREELAEVTTEEGRHLLLCLEGIDATGFRWGHWDVHISLWNTVSTDDSLIDRILIVHRYLEGSGLDAGDSILRRLGGVASKAVRNSVNIIVEEEINHVRFGSRWYKKICEQSRLDPDQEFAGRIGRIAALAPRRERLARELRLKAGFTAFELSELEKYLPAHNS